MSDPVLWKCLFNGAEELTVGKEFNLHCEGTIGVPLEKNLQLELPPDAAPFTLKLLAVTDVQPTSVDVKLTAYRPGQFKLPYLRLTDGKVTIDSGEVEWNVTALSNQESKPTPPMGPFELEIPQSIYLIGALILALILLTLAGILLAKRRKKRLEALLAENKSHMSPLRQFEAELRRLRREVLKNAQLESSGKAKIIADLNRAVRVYWMQKFVFNTMGVRRQKLVKMILRRLKKPDPQTWNRYFIELDLSLAKPAQLDQASLIKLIEQSSQVLHVYENSPKTETEKRR